jgi:hypothetical protein|tara:strand:+ start:1379 stop:1621 length:243 start_codon:yes stop_codon:yes gene_type:complete
MYCKARICTKCTKEEEQKKVIEKWQEGQDEKIPPGKVWLCMNKTFNAVWICPRPSHRLLPHNLKILSTQEFTVRVATPVR